MPTCSWCGRKIDTHCQDIQVVDQNGKVIQYSPTHYPTCARIMVEHIKDHCQGMVVIGMEPRDVRTRPFEDPFE